MISTGRGWSSDRREPPPLGTGRDSLAGGRAAAERTTPTRPAELARRLTASARRSGAGCERMTGCGPPRSFRVEGSRRRLGLASMGPRAFTRGDDLSGASEGDNDPLLQWGHAHSRVETPLLIETPAAVMLLQWGHAHSRVETGANAASGGRRVGASMGPRAFTRGDQPRRLAGTGGARGGFNGATRIHAWRPWSRWRPPNPVGCFNGATRIHAWRLSKTRRITPGAKAASMGPRAFTRGDSLGNLVDPDDHRGASMGPRAFTRGDLGIAAGGYHVPGASMGPRAFTRGDLSIIGQPSENVPMLQWGHAHSRVETVLGGSRHKRKVGTLQWGHAHSRVETWPTRAMPWRSRARFNGATRIHAWRPE